MAPADPPPTRTPHRRPAPTAPRTRTHPHPSRPPPEHPPGPDQRTRTRHTPRHHPHRSIPPMAQHPTTTDPHRLTPIGASNPRPRPSQEPHTHHRVKGFTPGRTGTGRHSDPTPGGKGPSFGRHSNTTRSAGPGLSAPAPRTFVIEGLRTRVPIPGELPPSPERPTSGSLRPSAVSARTRSSGSPTLASPPVRRQPLCNPTTLNTHPRTTCETPAKRSGRYDIGHTSHDDPSRRLPRDHAGAPQGKRHGPDLCVRWIA